MRPAGISQSGTTLCAHFQPGPCPWETEIVLDEHLGPTEWLVGCRTCGRGYLLELLDWRRERRLFRVRAPTNAAIALLTRDLNRGSCDLNRAGEEVRHFSLSSDRLPELLLYDTASAEVIERITLDDPGAVPWSSWRDLPCDGTWIDRYATH